MNSGVLNVIQNSDFIHLITESILNENDHNLILVSTELLADDFHFTLYLSKSHAILLGIQPNITRVSLKQVIGKCLRVYEEYKIQPYVAILCASIASPVKLLLSSTPQNSLWQVMDCTMWAEKFVIVSKNVADLSDTEASRHLDPLVVLAIYFSGDENRKQYLQDVGNPTMQFMHSIQ